MNNIEKDYCGQTQPHASHPWATPREYMSTAPPVMHQCAGLLPVPEISGENPRSREPFEADRCLTCGLPRVVPGEGRWCEICQGYPGTCAQDHCMFCGSVT